jgi:DtxR family Mn-dependent transcriptional regulator
MYLVMIALLRETPHSPVPLSLLAQKLAISPVSVNEMCRKLDEQGVVQYQPYKGVMLTPAGERDAQLILSRRRLWVVFLVEELGIEPDEADDIACQLEHITSEKLVSALKVYLEHVPTAAQTCPQATLTTEPPEPALPLTTLAAGQQASIAAITADSITADFLHAQGCRAGVRITLLALSDAGTVLLELGEHRLALAAPLAAQITVTRSLAPAARPCTWDKCRTFWQQTAELCPRLADADTSLQPCARECLTTS